MNSQELIILFIGILLASTLVVTTLYSTVQSWTNTAENVSSDVKTRVAADYQVIEVSRGLAETNIYVQGISGKLNPENVLVIVNGTSYTPTISFIRDESDKNILNTGDILLIRIPVTTSDSDCIRLGIDGVYTTLGVC